MLSTIFNANKKNSKQLPSEIYETIKNDLPANQIYEGEEKRITPILLLR